MLCQTDDVDFDAVADELYGVELGAFTPTRDVAVQRARADGDAVTARKIQALRKPTVAAWLVNQLVRRKRDEVELLLDLGGEMRAGITGLTGDELRVLTRRRHQLVAALLHSASTLSDSGQVTPAIETAVRTTLEATLADATSADLVAAARLIQPLQVSGFGSGEAGSTSGAAVFAPQTAGPDADVVDLSARRDRQMKAMDKAQHEVASAEKASRKAHARREKVETKLRDAEAEAKEHAASVDRLESELAAATERRTDADHVVGRRQEKADAAEGEARAADRRLADARQRLRELTR